MSHETMDLETVNTVNPDELIVDAKVRELDISSYVQLLKEAGVSDRLHMSDKEVLDVLDWADMQFSVFVQYRDALGFDVPTSLEEYLVVHDLSPNQWREAYFAELEERLAAAELIVWQEYEEELHNLEANVRFDAQMEGCDSAQTNWRVQQALTWKRSEISSHTLIPLRSAITEEVRANHPPQKRLPTLRNRFYQLAELCARQAELAADGKATKLIPVPYKSIDENILPSFSLNDTSVRQWPNHGRGLGDFYLDKRYIDAQRGAQGRHRTHVTGTYYEKALHRDEQIGDFGLALVAAGDGVNGIDQSMTLDDIRTHDYHKNSKPELAKADFAIGIAWALQIVQAVEQGRIDIDNQPIKIVLPDFVFSKDEYNTALLSVYRIPSDNPYYRRLGMAIDAYSEAQARQDGYPVMQATSVW